MRKSLLVQIYLNMAAAYMKLGHYKLAQECCEDAQQMTNKVSQILFRKAQALAFNKSASISELETAYQLIS
jgi:tetratricopeptide (TPR) repeat protein